MKFIKRFIKYYLPTLIFIGALGILFLAYLAKNHDPIFMFVFGSARVHSNLADAIVKEDGIELQNAKVFILENGNKLLVYAPESKKNRSVIIVDKLKNNIGLSILGEHHYDLIFDRYLFQSHTAYDVVYAKGVKWELEPNLQISDKKITYRTQRLENKNYIDVNHEIIFKDK